MVMMPATRNMVTADSAAASRSMRVMTVMVSVSVMMRMSFRNLDFNFIVGLEFEHGGGTDTEDGNKRD